MSKVLDYEEYMGKRVKIRHSDKSTYRYLGLIGMCGTVERTSSSTIGVRVDGKTNESGSYGVFWFRRSDLEILENESEEVKMEGFKYVAIVKLLEDCYEKNYGFALYDEDMKLLENGGYSHDEGYFKNLVVVNPRSKDKRVLGKVTLIMPIDDYKDKVTAQVVGVVNMDRYIARVEEENRLKELAKKKAAIEKELEAEINKIKTAEFYKEMANKYPDNPRLAELVSELEELGA